MSSSKHFRIATTLSLAISLTTVVLGWQLSSPRNGTDANDNGRIVSDVGFRQPDADVQVKEGYNLYEMSVDGRKLVAIDNTRDDDPRRAFVHADDGEGGAVPIVVSVQHGELVVDDYLLSDRSLFIRRTRFQDDPSDILWIMDRDLFQPIWFLKYNSETGELRPASSDTVRRLTQQCVRDPTD